MNLSLGRSAIVSILIKGSSAVLTFAMFILLARALGDAGFGDFSIAFSVATFLGVVASCGLHTGIMRWWPEREHDDDHAGALRVAKWGLSVSLAASLAVAAATFLCGLLLAVLGFEIGDALLWSAFLIVPLVLAEFVASAMRAAGWIAPALAPRDVIWRSFVCAAFVFVIVRRIEIDFSAAILLLAGSLLAAVAVQSLIWMRDVLRVRLAAGSLLQEAEKLRAGVHFLIPSVVFAAVLYADTLVVGIFVGSEEAGGYFASSRISSTLMISLVAINAFAAPLISKLHQGGRLGEMQGMLSKLCVILFVSNFPLFLIIVVWGESLLELFSESYGRHYWVLCILSFGAIFNSLCGPTGYLLQMTGRERYFARMFSVTYVLILIAQLLATWRFGVIGAATCTALGQVAWNVLARRECVRRMGVDPTIFGVVGRLVRRGA